jgi:high-affinity nickel-transport protein
VLFGLGFDTASTVLLLAVSAIASSKTQHPSHLVLLPLLFTSAMTAVDSLDGIIMAWAYAPSHHQKSWRLYDVGPQPVQEVIEKKEFITNRVSLVLTVASIFMALSISIIEFMGLAADKLHGADKPGLGTIVWGFFGS